MFHVEKTITKFFLKNIIFEYMKTNVPKRGNVPNRYISSNK